MPKKVLFKKAAAKAAPARRGAARSAPVENTGPKKTGNRKAAIWLSDSDATDVRRGGQSKVRPRKPDARKPVGRVVELEEDGFDFDDEVSVKTKSSHSGAPQSEKLQKVLARSGLGSRRELETWISEGRVSINGKIVVLGERVSEGDKIRVDGNLVDWRADADQQHRIICYHKPEGEVCSRKDPEGRPSVFDHLPSLPKGRWVLVGRLDLNTSGLMLFTTDGELAHRLMHPSYAQEREYAVRVLGEVQKEVLATLREGVELEDGRASFDMIREAGGAGANHWYHVILKEGRNREVRRLWESQGVKVSRLIRVRFAMIALDRHLKKGRWNDLEETLAKELYQSVKLNYHPRLRKALITRKKAAVKSPQSPRSAKKVVGKKKMIRSAKSGRS